MSNPVAKSAGILITTKIEEEDENGLLKTVNISSADVMKLHIIPLKAGSSKIVDAVFKTNGEDGKMDYWTTKTTFESGGQWRLHPYIEMTGYEGYTSPFEIMVDDAP
jgi:hypothetical protein